MRTDGYCKLGEDLCNCGGDLPRIQAACSEWFAVPTPARPMTSFTEEGMRLASDLRTSVTDLTQPFPERFIDALNALRHHLQTMETELAAARKVVRAANAVAKHWAEFGPEHGFGETMERLFAMLANDNHVAEAGKMVK